MMMKKRVNQIKVRLKKAPFCIETKTTTIENYLSIYDAKSKSHLLKKSIESRKYNDNDNNNSTNTNKISPTD